MIPKSGNRFSVKIMRHYNAQVSLRLGREMLDFFQAEGPGWQERINAALRKVVGTGGGTK
jgi:uncharacterized protein (DUF4415 family)